MTSILSPGRVSQNLPIPKCSTCNQFVPLDQLGEHICALTSPVPKLTTAAAATLLPKRLQPGSPVPSTSRSVSPVRHEPSQSRGPPLSIPGNSPTKATFQPRPSPLASSTRDTLKTSSMLTPLPQPNARTRAPSNASINQPTRPNFNQDAHYSQPLGPPPSPLGPPPSSPGQGIRASNRGGPPLAYRGPPRVSSIPRPDIPANTVPIANILPPPNIGSPSPQKVVDPGIIIPTTNLPPQSFVPPPERGIDTKTGGEAGMAGVGRRGFAAVARAAMFALPPNRPLGPQTQIKPNRPNYLDLDALSRPTETPPLSAGSGYSSHSPGPTSPQPQSDLSPQPLATKITRTPSPLDQFLSTPRQSASLKPATSDPVSLTSPLSARLPFFEKFKSKIPGNTSDSANNDSPISSLNSSTPTPTSIVRKKTSDSSMLYRSVTSSTDSSRHAKDVRRPISPVDSESEYGGLAYADSTDFEDNDSRSQSKNDSRPAMRKRTGSNPSSFRYRSGSEFSENSRTGILIGSSKPRLGLSRNNSTSSASSLGGDRSNSSAIAQALGLSQTLPSDYGKLGGPGMGGRSGRNESLSRRNAGPDSTEEMAKALEEAKIKTRAKQPSFGSSSQRSFNLYRADTTTSSASSRKDDNVIGSSGPKAHRSNTIQTPSPESKPIKLPMRSLTSPIHEREKALDGTSVKKERVRNMKVCLKCQKVVDNGRWVSVDGGGVLCEKCWKNMYLPKCRRCNLSIEKQAVSSSDGQLKGKYHKECFNCETCHKPFPDKTFYVYDGKPLCAYHYHEANDSLCAAARCGQPIEGPCAVSHSGDRYHPEHMTCEYPGYPTCKQMLSEYWEIDGRMLCERHAHSASVRGSDGEEEDEEWVRSTRAKKRVTRFIDLAGGLGDSGLI